MEKVELKFLRITYSHTHAGAYALILSEMHGDRRLPIIIGGVEAQAIAIQIENIPPSRTTCSRISATSSTSGSPKW